MNIFQKISDSLLPKFKDHATHDLYGRVGIRDHEKKVGAVIVNFSTGICYDTLLQSQKQVSQPGTQTSVFMCHPSSIKQMMQALKKNHTTNESLREIMDDIEKVDYDCVVFNWECCSHYAGKQFPEGNKTVLKFARKMIDRGHMVMFSDYSLKTLIENWIPKYLGPKIFHKIGEYGGQIQLNFKSDALRKSPSNQLRIVGELATEDHCHIHAVGGTTVFTCDQNAESNEVYELEILSVVSSLKNMDDSCEIGDARGPIGHAILRYQSGGCLLVSMGHWNELTELQTNAENVLRVSEKYLGASEGERMRDEYQSIIKQQGRAQYLNKNAFQLIKLQAPCLSILSKNLHKF